MYIAVMMISTDEGGVMGWMEMATGMEVGMG